MDILYFIHLPLILGPALNLLCIVRVFAGFLDGSLKIKIKINVLYKGTDFSMTLLLLLMTGHLILTCGLYTAIKALVLMRMLVNVGRDMYNTFNQIANGQDVVINNVIGNIFTVVKAAKESLILIGHQL